jgi:cysteine-rich repeat protein
VLLGGLIFFWPGLGHAQKPPECVHNQDLGVQHHYVTIHSHMLYGGDVFGAAISKDLPLLINLLKRAYQVGNETAPFPTYLLNHQPTTVVHQFTYNFLDYVDISAEKLCEFVDSTVYPEGTTARYVTFLTSMSGIDVLENALKNCLFNGGLPAGEVDSKTGRGFNHFVNAVAIWPKWHGGYQPEPNLSYPLKEWDFIKLINSPAKDEGYVSQEPLRVPFWHINQSYSSNYPGMATTLFPWAMNKEGRLDNSSAQFRFDFLSHLAQRSVWYCTGDCTSNPDLPNCRDCSTTPRADESWEAFEGRIRNCGWQGHGSQNLSESLSLLFKEREHVLESLVSEFMNQGFDHIAKPKPEIARPSRCGDSKVETKYGEECDDGNQIDDDLCSNYCKKAACGDGVVNGAEVCDPRSETADATCAIELFGKLMSQARPKIVARCSAECKCIKVPARPLEPSGGQ